MNSWLVFCLCVDCKWIVLECKEARSFRLGEDPGSPSPGWNVDGWTSEDPRLARGPREGGACVVGAENNARGLSANGAAGRTRDLRVGDCVVAYWSKERKGQKKYISRAAWLRAAYVNVYQLAWWKMFMSSPHSFWFILFVWSFIAFISTHLACSHHHHPCSYSMAFVRCVRGSVAWRVRGYGSINNSLSTLALGVCFKIWENIWIK